MAFQQAATSSFKTFYFKFIPTKNQLLLLLSLSQLISSVKLVNRVFVCACKLSCYTLSIRESQLGGAYMPQLLFRTNCFSYILVKSFLFFQVCTHLRTRSDLFGSRFNMAGRHHSAGHLQRALQAEEHPSPPLGYSIKPPGFIRQLQGQEAEAFAGRAQQEPSAVPDQPRLPVTAGGCWAAGSSRPQY